MMSGRFSFSIATIQKPVRIHRSISWGERIPSGEKMRVSFIGLAALVAAQCATASATVIGGPIVNQVNGHTYYLLSQNTWTASQAEAVTLGGTLAIPSDPLENVITINMFGGKNLWIGLYDPTQDTGGPGPAHTANFVWVNGDPTPTETGQLVSRTTLTAALSGMCIRGGMPQTLP